jgi:hypothetical protein
MEKMFLSLKNPKEAIKWDKKKPLIRYGDIGRTVTEIRPVVSQCGETRYFFGDTELHDGCWFVPNETGGYHVMTMDEIKNKYVIL